LDNSNALYPLIWIFPLLSVITADIFDFKKNSLEYLLIGINPISLEPKKKPAIEKPNTSGTSPKENGILSNTPKA
jgi:hypothetical protein